MMQICDLFVIAKFLFLLDPTIAEKVLYFGCLHLYYITVFVDMVLTLQQYCNS